MDRLMNKSMDGRMDGGMDCGTFYEGDTYQWLEEEEEDDGVRGNWEDISVAIDFAAGHNGDVGGGGPVEGRES